MTTKTAAKAAKPEKPIKRMGGARPGAGRTQTTYKISIDAAKRLHIIAKHYGNAPEELLEGLINNHHTEIEKTRISDEANQLLNILTPEPQTVDTISKRLRIPKTTLETLITHNHDELISHGLHLHVATHSEVARAIKLPSTLNSTEHTYYNKLSRTLFR
jgi:hypothetical protein